MKLQRIAMTAIFSALLLATSGVFAQQGAQPPAQGTPPPAQGAQPAQVDDATIGKFADSLEKVQAIQNKFSRQLQGIDTNEEAQKLREEAQQEMVSAIQGSGLTIDEYNSLARTLDQDQDLRQRVKEELDNR